MRKFLYFLILVLMMHNTLTAQQKVSRVGRWAQGNSEAVYRRGGYTFVGNGAYLELYNTINGEYQKLDEILMPATVRDIWVRGNLSFAYVACGTAGLQIVSLDLSNQRFVTINSTLNTPGSANGVFQSGNYAYIADGSNGLLISNISNPYNPLPMGTYPTSYPALEVWIANDSTALVAADTAGLYAIKILDPRYPSAMDSLKFHANEFPGYVARAHSVITQGDYAYVAAGYGGMVIINMADPSNIHNGVIGRWIDTVPVDVRSVWITNEMAYLAGGDHGIFGPIDVTNPALPGNLPFPPLDTQGFSTEIVVSEDTLLFIGDGYNGHLLVNAVEGIPPDILNIFPGADNARDMALSGNYGYAAVGRSGIKVFNIDFSGTRSDTLHMNELETYDTPGEAMSVRKQGNFLYVADGTGGLLSLDALDPVNLTYRDQFPMPGDICYDVDVPAGSYAYAACGVSGFRVINISGTMTQTGIQDTPGNCRGIKVVNDTAYVADEAGGLYIYDVANPLNMHLIASFTDTMDAMAVRVQGNLVFVANGRHGLLVWNRMTGKRHRIETAGICTDIELKQKTMYFTDSGRGLVLYDNSIPGEYNEVGYYETEEDALGIAVSENSGILGLSDGRDGIFMLRSTIAPGIQVSQTSLNFGPVPPDYSRPLITWVHNTGTTLLEVSSVTAGRSEFKFSSGTFSVPPGTSYRLEARFEPTVLTQVGVPIVASASLVSNAGNITFTLQGEVKPLVTSGPFEPDYFTRALYHFEEGSGTLTQDASVNDLDGELKGNATWSTVGPLGRNISFDGENSWVEVNYSSLLNFTNSPFTAEMWFLMREKPESKYILIRRGDFNANTRQFEITVENGDEGIVGNVWTGSLSAPLLHQVKSGSIAELNSNQWYHVALTWDTDILRLYVNDILKDSKTVHGNLINETTEALGIGGSVKGEVPLNGLIDEVRLSNVARQAWEFHVNRSRMVVNRPLLDFAEVFNGYSRDLPFTITNTGSQALQIYDISANRDEISIHFPDDVVLENGDSRTFHAVFSPDADEVIGGDNAVIIQSSDPTYPNYRIPVKGQGSLGLPAGAYGKDPFTIGLYHFDESVESFVYDTSGYHMDGRIYGSVLYDNSRIRFGSGYSLRFDSSDDLCKIETGEEHRINPEWGGLTVEGWFYVHTLPSSGKATLISRQYGTTGQFNLFLNSDGLITGRMYNEDNENFDVTSASVGNIQPGNWYHLALSYGDSTVKLYVNGNRVATTKLTGNLAGTTPDAAVDTLSILLGRDWNGLEPFTGNIDEFRISNIGREKWEYNVVMARVDLSVAELDFDEVLIGEERLLKMWVRNPGIDTLMVDSTASSHAGLVFPDTTVFQVAPGDSQLVRISFTPVNTAPLFGQLTLWTNDPFWHTRPVYFRGEGIETRPVGAYRPDPYTIGLYHFNEGQGSVIEDSSGASRDGILLGEPDWSPDGRFNKAVDFGHYTEWAEIAFNPAPDFTESDFTAEFWFNITTKPSGEALLLRYASNELAQFEIILSNTNNEGLRARVWDLSGERHVLAGMPMDELHTGQWYHTALMYDGDSLYFSLNNKRRDQKGLTYGLRSADSSAITLAGNEAGSKPFTGKIDEIRISTIMRSQWEINVLEPDIEVFPDNINFATVLVNESRTISFYISNYGDQVLNVTSITGPEGQFSIPSNLAPFSLYRYQSQRVAVTYLPDVVEVTHKDTILITSNDTEDPVYTVFLEGSGDTNKEPEPYITDAHTLALYHFSGTPQDTVISDASGTGIIAYLRNGTTIIEGNGFILSPAFGSVLSFDGINDYVYIPSNGFISFDPYIESYTIECFFKTDTVSQALVYKGYEDDGYVPNYGLFINQDGRIRMAGFGEGGPRINDNSWHHLAFTFNHLTRQGRLYIDGALAWTKPWSPPDNAVYGDRPLLIGAMENPGGGILAPFKGYMDELRISDIAREPWEFQMMDYGIRLTSTSPDTFRFNTETRMNMYVPAALEPNGMALFYRPGGTSQYTRIEGLATGNNNYQITLPGEAVTLRGIEYYVEVYSGQDTISMPVLDPVNNPTTQVVRHITEMPAEITFPFKQLDMFSLPFDLDDRTPRDVLEDDLGEFDPYQWRLFWWQRWDSVYVEYMSGNEDYFVFEPGRAYWMITDEDRSFDITPFSTIDTDSSFGVSLYAGWNMISNPFNFPVLWNDCSVNSESVYMLTFYDTEIRGFRLDWPVLEPWKGYLLYNSNADAVPEKLYIPPIEGSLNKSAGIRNGILGHFKENEWMIRLSVKTRDAADPDNFAGVRLGAEAGWDLRDRPEPPPIGEYISLYFDQSDWSGHEGTFAADIRPAGEDGYIWEFDIESRLAGAAAQLSWQLHQTLPEGWDALLFDADGNAVPCLKESVLTFTTPKNVPNVRHFTLIVGSKAFIEQHGQDIPQPAVFHLYQNYPNPFNLETSIRYSLPGDDRVELIIYNSLGQQIRTLVNTDQKTGDHEIIWNGMDDRYRIVASGVYFYRIKTSGQTAVRKMIIVK